jgi:hypothetical protein
MTNINMDKPSLQDPEGVPKLAKTMLSIVPETHESVATAFSGTYAHEPAPHSQVDSMGPRCETNEAETLMSMTGTKLDIQPCQILAVHLGLEVDDLPSGCLLLESGKILVIVS